jgi:hypothetical protein
MIVPACSSDWSKGVTSSNISKIKTLYMWMSSHRQKTHTHMHALKICKPSRNVHVSSTLLDGFIVSTQLLKLYKAWSKSIWTVFISLVPYMTLRWGFSECPHVFLHILNQQDLNEAIQSNAITTSKHWCLCHALYLWCLRAWIMHVYQISYKI